MEKSRDVFIRFQKTQDYPCLEWVRLSLFNDSLDKNDFCWLSPGELEKIKTFKFLPRKRSWLAGRYAVKKAAARYIAQNHGLALPLSEIEIFSNSQGVPCLGEEWPKKYFIKQPLVSISHSDPWAVGAVGGASKCLGMGIDIEHVARRETSWAEMAFHPTEELSHHDPLKQTRAWSLKESILKALGLGLTVDLHELRFAKPFQEDQLRMMLYGRVLKRCEEMGLGYFQCQGWFQEGTVASLAVARG